MNVIILCGLPGSGKSSYIDREHPNKVNVICEADQFFMEGGKYVFDKSKIGLAHEFCFSEFMRAVSTGRVWRTSARWDDDDDDDDGTFENVDNLVVANTNTQLHEISPYVTVAKYYGHPFEIVKLECSVETAIKRNIHNVPEATIRDMDYRLRRLNIPKHWNSKTINTEG